MQIDREKSQTLNHLRQRLRQAGIIEGVEAHHFDVQRLVCMRCGDGRHTADHHKHLESLMGGGQDGVIHHLVTFNGGPIFLGPLLPMLRRLQWSFQKGNREVVAAIFRNLFPTRLIPKVIAFLHGLFQVKQSLAIFRSSDVRTISLTTHFPCGAAALQGYTEEDQIWCLVKAKRRLKRIFGSEVKVICFVHFAYGVYDDGGRENGVQRRTYKLNADRAAAWLQGELSLPVLAADTSSTITLPISPAV